MTPKLTAVPDPPERPAPPDLREAVAAAVGEMPWLVASDRALVAVALNAAEQIETAADRAREFEELQREFAGDVGPYKRLLKLEAMCDLAKLVGWLGPQLQGYLKDLGGTPVARKAMATDKPIGGRLEHLRRNAAAAQSPTKRPAAKRAPRKQAARQHDAAPVD